MWPLAVPKYPQRHAWHLYIVRVDQKAAGLTRDEFMLRLKERGIGTGLHFRAAHLHAYHRAHYPPRTPLPSTEWNSERVCSLPLFPDMRLDEVDRVVDAIRAVVAEARS